MFQTSQVHCTNPLILIDFFHRNPQPPPPPHLLSKCQCLNYDGKLHKCHNSSSSTNSLNSQRARDAAKAANRFSMQCYRHHLHRHRHHHRTMITMAMVTVTTIWHISVRRPNRNWINCTKCEIMCEAATQPAMIRTTKQTNSTKWFIAYEILKISHSEHNGAAANRCAV